ncbi:MAG TPA: DUF559 domain-containing protein [Longimicrobium sp.]|nr:DUF559 domain-containing protein [Longimicrobium sp.]
MRERRIRGVDQPIQDAAKRLRQDMTPAEKVLWQGLRRGGIAGLRFRRQHALGKFVLDFYCARARLAVEVDGDVHDHQQDRDDARTAILLGHGIRVLRVRNDEVLGALADVLAKIEDAAVKRLKPTGEPSPPRSAVHPR